jgi:hypothetical protein
MSNQSNGFPVFWFEGNRWFGEVSSLEKLASLLAEYPIERVLRAKSAAAFPGTKPNFGFRAEHAEAPTFGEWLVTPQAVHVE